MENSKKTVPSETKKLNPMGMGPGSGPNRGMMKGQKPKNFKKTMLKLGVYCLPFLPILIISLLFAVTGTLLDVYAPKVLAKITGELYNAVSLNRPVDFVFIKNIILILIGIYVLNSLFIYIQGYLLAGISQKISYQFRKNISEKMNRVPLSYFDSRNYGDVLSRITNDVDTVSSTLNQTLVQVITSITTFVGVVVMMFTINVVMTLVTFILIPLMLICIAVVVKQSQKYFASQQSTLGELNGHIEEMYSGHLVVKAFNGEEQSIGEFQELNNSLFNSAWKSQFFSGLMMPIVKFIGNIGYVAISILGGYYAVTGVIQVEDIQSFLLYIRKFTQPLNQIANISNVMQSTAAAAERVFEFLDEEEEVADCKDPHSISNVVGDVTLDHVKFGYSSDKMIIHDLNLKVKNGSKIAIVGPTGAGKTTIVNLLMRFYELNSGNILVDGINITSFERRELRKLFGMVLQDTWLFNGTIRENIKYGKLDATDAEMIAAAKAAHVHHFVKTLSQGYDTVLNEEASNLSQGQKQLITIARAILSNSPIMILDEATSSVDTRTEVLIQEAMNNLTTGRTSFIIAHRLSTIKNADTILVMKDGDIVEQGNHNELIEKNGFYATLYNAQFEEKD